MIENYKIRSNYSKRYDYDDILGYWEEQTIGDDDNLWCGNYDKDGDSIGVWTLITPERKILTRLRYSKNSKTEYIMEINEINLFYKNKGNHIIHIEEHEQS